jgi:amino acid adenylation domain-containing protein
MDTTQNFSCFLIGEGTLLIRCAEILVNRGHAISGIISSDRKVHNWAQERNLSLIDLETGDIVRFLSQQPFDYLFSIVNPLILSKQVLELPHRGAINYHDAPLPKYAGNYATSWAIMQGEREHGITWHAMTDLADAGEIFKQRFFKINDNETAFSLNTKCYDAAVSSFSELIDDIASRNVSVKRQNLNERSFYPLYKRPSSGCVLCWSHSAREILDFVRALSFGRYDNPLGLPKLAVGMDFVIVQEIEGTDRSSANLPGTITRIDPCFVNIATGDSEVMLKKLLTIDGQPLLISDFVKMFGLYEGYRFKELDQEVAARITTYNTSACRYEEFWKKYLGTLEKATLPYVQQHAPSIQAEQHLHVSMPVPQEVINHLVEYHETWPVEDFLLAAFVAYLARLGGAWSFDLGYRDVELKLELASLEGMFSAYAFLHVDIEPSQSFEEVFHTVGEQVKQTKKRKMYARDIIARFPNLQWEAKLQGVYQPSILVERLETLDHYQLPQGVELAFIILEGGRECFWVYNTEVLHAENVGKMQRELITFIQESIADSHALVSNLPLVTEQERHQLLEEWNATQADYPREQCVHELFEEQVQRTPEAVAVIFEGAQLTYQELNQQANQLAHYLQQQGVGSETLVGLCVERTLEMVIGLLGILKAGGAYVPLDPTYPAERLAFMLEDAQVSMLVTQRSVLTQILHPGTRTICLDTNERELASQSTENLAKTATSNMLAYVIYTSGSTGRPKGVQIPHRAVVNFLLSMRRQPGLKAEDTLLSVTTLSFDIAALEIFLPLITGARLVIASQEVVTSGTALAETVARTGTTVMQATPVTWRILLASGWQGDKGLKVLCGGEALPLDLAHQLLSKVASLYNMYGPTETTVWSSVYEIKPHHSLISIGRPIANTQIYLLDEHLQLVPVGAPGELYIGGDGLARGYLHRPELTEERFVHHPFSTQPEARIYRTGDLARYRTDGTIELIGRIDHQVKIRGFRIELGEIEAILRHHPQVREAAVMAQEDTPGKRLVAYLVAVQESLSLPKASELRHFLATKLPEYMLPSAFVFLEAFPLTSNGKLDRHALTALPLEQTEQNENYAAPGTSVEEILAQVWTQVLGLKQVGIYDNFFDLGGHSLLATRIIARLNSTLGIKLSFSNLFKSPTIAELATVIEERLLSEIEELAEEEVERLIGR